MAHLPAHARARAGRGRVAGDGPVAASSRADVSPSVRAQRALEALPAAVMVVDAADTVLVWNAAAETLFETPVAGAVGRKFRDLDVSYRMEGLRARMEDVTTRQMSTRIEDVTFTRRGGDVVHAQVSIAPLFDAARFIGVLVTVDDATERARLTEQMTRLVEQHGTAIEELQSTNEELETTNEELQSTNEELETTVEELQAANAELAALNAELEERGAELARLDGYHRGVVDSLEDALIVVDRAAVVRTWNHAAEQIWSLRAEQVLGRQLFALPLGDLGRVGRPAFERMLETAMPQEVRVTYTLPAGTQQRAVVRLAAVTDGGGEIIGGVARAMTSDGAAG